MNFIIKKIDEKQKKITLMFSSIFKEINNSILRATSRYRDSL